VAFRVPSQHGLTPGGRGRFPDFDVLEQIGHWDNVTAGVVLARLDPPVDFSFFSPLEQATAGALFDQLLGQTAEPKIPVLGLIDRRLALDETDGWRYDDMPDDGEAWHVTLAALDDDSQQNHGAAFHEVDETSQCALVQAVQDCQGDWHDMAAPHVWSLWTRYACAAFYSHPWAWNEIGFGGPAYPRGYKALGENRLEPWEVRASTPPHDR
jgi:hypothetical protein